MQGRPERFGVTGRRLADPPGDRSRVLHSIDGEITMAARKKGAKKGRKAAKKGAKKGRKAAKKRR